MKLTVKVLVSRGRLEFATGGWVEAGEDTWEQMIANVAIGHKFLKSTFG